MGGILGSSPYDDIKLCLKDKDVMENKMDKFFDVPAKQTATQDKHYDQTGNSKTHITQYSLKNGLVLITCDDWSTKMTNEENLRDIISVNLIGEDFKKLKAPLLIDVSSSDKNSAFIKGNLRFSSTLSFNNQIDSGVIESATLDPLTNGYLDIDQNSSGETAKIKPVIFDQLDNNLGDPNGKKAIVGLSKYGLDINQKDYQENL